MYMRRSERKGLNTSAFYWQNRNRPSTPIPLIPTTLMLKFENKFDKMEWLPGLNLIGALPSAVVPSGNISI